MYWGWTTFRGTGVGMRTPRAEVLAKQDRAIDLVRAGKSYDEIARALG